MNSNSDSRPAIFLVEVDDDTRPVIKANLQRGGYRVILAFDEEDATERAAGAGFHADLILIDSDGQPNEVLDAARRIRASAGLRAETPIVVISSVYPKELEGKDVAVTETEYIAYLDEPHQLRNLLHRVLPARAVA